MASTGKPMGGESDGLYEGGVDRAAGIPTGDPTACGIAFIPAGNAFCGDAMGTATGTGECDAGTSTWNVWPACTPAGITAFICTPCGERNRTSMPGWWPGGTQMLSRCIRGRAAVLVFLDRKCVKNPREFHPSLVSFLTLCDKVGYFGWRQFMLPLLRKLKLVSLFMSTAGHAPAPVAATIEAAKAAATRLPPGAPKFVLGSQSASRRAILAATGADFDAVVPDIDEKSIGDRARDAPEDLVRRIAIAKADALLAATADSHAGSVLITGDQVFK